MNTEHL